MLDELAAMPVFVESPPVKVHHPVTIVCSLIPWPDEVKTKGFDSAAPRRSVAGACRQFICGLTWSHYLLRDLNLLNKPPPVEDGPEGPRQKQVLLVTVEQ